MFKDKTLRRYLYGSHTEIEKTSSPGNRSYTIIFPAREDGDSTRRLKYAGDDGLILYFLKRIERLEEKVANLKATKK